MEKFHKLRSEELEASLAQLYGWSIVDSKLHRDLKFKNFSEAFAFMTRVAMEAHLMDHHPEWFNVYSKVTLDLTTHEAGGISNLDIELAEQINRFLTSDFD